MVNSHAALSAGYSRSEILILIGSFVVGRGSALSQRRLSDHVMLHKFGDTTLPRLVVLFAGVLAMLIIHKVTNSFFLNPPRSFQERLSVLFS